MNRYSSIPIVSNPISGTKYRKNTKYPVIPYSINDIYVVASDGDRFDSLANQYYNDPTLWWIIPTANPHVPQDSLYAPLETQLRIPADPGAILSRYKQLNS